MDKPIEDLLCELALLCKQVGAMEASMVLYNMKHLPQAPVLSLQGFAKYAFLEMSRSVEGDSAAYFKGLARQVEGLDGCSATRIDKIAGHVRGAKEVCGISVATGLGAPSVQVAP